MAREGTFCKSNKTSMPYDPITLQYGEGKDGQCLRYSDESLRYRAAMRAANLQQRTNVAGFNPITGEETARVPVPEKPVLPEYLHTKRCLVKVKQNGDYEIHRAVTSRAKTAIQTPGARGP